MNTIEKKKTPANLKKGATRIIVGAVVILTFIVGYRYGQVQKDAKAREGELEAGPHVQVAPVNHALDVRQVTMIGETRPYASVTLYAKVSGYIKEMNVDKGDVVKKGQVLAFIESPETDKAYLAALADARNKKAIAARMQTLLKQALVSPQEAEQAQSDADVSSARLESQGVEKNYEKIIAPFDGTVTARFADPGALVQNAMNAQTGALPLVTVSTINRLRVDVFLDQHDAPFVQKNDAVEITSAERPGGALIGHVDRISGELDTRTKTLLTEIDLTNDKNELVPGSFVHVSLKLKMPTYLQIPSDALIIKDDKYMALVVDAENIAHYKKVEVGEDDGKNVIILSGLSEGEKVALNLGTTVTDGSKVRPTLVPSKEVAKEPKEPTKDIVSAKTESLPPSAEPTKALSMPTESKQQ